MSDKDDPITRRRHSGRDYDRARPPKRPKHRGLATPHGPSAEEMERVKGEQGDINNAAAFIFNQNGEDPAKGIAPVLHIDGRDGPATSGTRAAVDNFFKEVLEGEDLGKDAPVIDSRQKAAEAIAKLMANKDPEFQRRFTAKFDAAKAKAAAAIQAIGNPPNGYDKLIGGAPDAKDAKVEPIKTEPPKDEVAPESVLPPVAGRTRTANEIVPSVETRAPRSGDIIPEVEQRKPNTKFIPV